MATLTEPGYEAYTAPRRRDHRTDEALGAYAERRAGRCCVCPGLIDTPMNARLAEEIGGIDKLEPIIRQHQPNARLITTREVANVVPLPRVRRIDRYGSGWTVLCRRRFNRRDLAFVNGCSYFDSVAEGIVDMEPGGPGQIGVSRGRVPVVLETRRDLGQSVRTRNAT